MVIKALGKIKSVTSVSRRAGPEEPKGVRIALSVCACYHNERLSFFTKQTERIAELLDVSLEQLQHFAITAMLSKHPVVVACYKQRDVAETKRAQLKKLTPFIMKPCHSFELLDDA